MVVAKLLKRGLGRPLDISGTRLSAVGEKVSVSAVPSPFTNAASLMGLASGTVSNDPVLTIFGEDFSTGLDVFGGISCFGDNLVRSVEPGVKSMCAGLENEPGSEVSRRLGVLGGGFTMLAAAEGLLARSRVMGRGVGGDLRAEVEAKLAILKSG